MWSLLVVMLALTCNVSSRIVGSGVNSLQNHHAVDFANNDKEVGDLLKISLQRLVEKKPPNVKLDLKDVRENKFPDLFAKHCQTTLTDAQIEDIIETARKELTPDKVDKLTRIMLQLAHGSNKEQKIAFLELLLFTLDNVPENDLYVVYHPLAPVKN